MDEETAGLCHECHWPIEWPQATIYRGKVLHNTCARKLWVANVIHTKAGRPLRADDVERPKAETDAEKAAEQMTKDILGGKITKTGRKLVRDACDHMDRPKTGKARADEALGNLSRKG